MRDINILYIHGMGGGGDSRIPSILSGYFASRIFTDAGATESDEANVAGEARKASESGEARETLEAKDAKDAKEANVAGEAREASESGEARETLEAKDAKEANVAGEAREASESGEARETLEAKDAKDANVADDARKASESGEADEANVAGDVRETNEAMGARENREVSDAKDTREVEEVRVNVVVRTYDFNPDAAHRSIMSWVDELRPEMIIGESLGAVQALRTCAWIAEHGARTCEQGRMRPVPHLFVSPSLNAPLYLGYLAFLALVPGVTALLDRIYRPKPGDRQRLHFSFRTLRRYRRHRREALRAVAETLREHPDAIYHAFFGTKDHYRKSGIVSVRSWKRVFGENSYDMYEGTHFMEQEHVETMLVDKIVQVLSLRCLQDR